MHSVHACVRPPGMVRLAVGLGEAVVGPEPVGREDAARPQPPRRERQRQPVGRDDAQEAPPRVGADGRHRLLALARHDERAVEQEARDAEEDRHADLEAHREVADERARVLGAREEGGVGAEHRDRRDRAQRIDEGKAVASGPHRRPYCQRGPAEAGIRPPTGRPRRGRRRPARALPLHDRPRRQRRRRLALLPLAGEPDRGRAAASSSRSSSSSTITSRRRPATRRCTRWRSPSSRSSAAPASSRTARSG